MDKIHKSPFKACFRSGIIKLGCEGEGKIESLKTLESNMQKLSALMSAFSLPIDVQGTSNKHFEWFTFV